MYIMARTSYIQWNDDVVRNRIGGVMVNMLVASAVDRGLECRLGQTKDYKIASQFRYHLGY
jgi:hypothetical protein